MPRVTTPPGNIPRPQQNRIEMGKFKGVDFTSGVVNVDPSRSPDAVNMMPDDDGYPRKRYGYDTVREYSGAVHGAYRFVFDDVNKQLVHAGNMLYDYDTSAVLYSAMASSPSCAVQLGGKLWIVDGSTYLVYDGTTVRPVSEIATVPIITVSKAPNGKGGATSYKPVNLLTGKRTDSYLGVAGETAYTLSFNGLSPTLVTAEILDGNGNWQPKTETTHFTVNRTAGIVTFTTAPGASPVAGEDNVRITYETATSGVDKINHCRFCILYGVNGALDRVFVAGNPEDPNVDYWSEFNDPAYMGDTFYGVLGQEGSPIMGYGVLNERLVTYKAAEENERNVFLRSGQLDEEGFAVFPISNVLQGEGPVSSRSFASISGEPVFLTRRGVFALTPGDITGERYAQSRSYFINRKLRAESGLENAAAVAFGRFYVLAINGVMYLLDTEQRSYAGKSPFSTYQYEGYYWTGIAAVCVWVRDNVLYFGTADGKVCRFKTAGTSADYNDDGRPIACRWTTPLLNLGIWSNLKTVTGVWVVTQPYTRSSAEIYYSTDRVEDFFVRKANTDIFDFADVDFARWTFNTLDTPTITAGRRKAKKVKVFAVQVRNAELNEPMGIFAIQIDSKVAGRIRR